MAGSELTITEGCDRASVTATGNLDHAMTVRLHARLHALVDSGIRYVLVDLSAVSDYHPTLDAALSRVAEQLRRAGGLLATAGADERLDAELAAATLVEVFTLYRSAPTPAPPAALVGRKATGARGQRPEEMAVDPGAAVSAPR